MLHGRAYAWLEVGRWDQFHPRAGDGLQVCLRAREPEQAHARRQVGEQVDVIVGTILAAGDAAFADDGQVELSLGPSEVKVHVPKRLQAEFEVEVEGDEVEIEVEFSWSRAQLESAAAAAGVQATSRPRSQHADGASSARSRSSSARTR